MEAFVFGWISVAKIRLFAKSGWKLVGAIVGNLVFAFRKRDFCRFPTSDCTKPKIPCFDIIDVC